MDVLYIVLIIIGIISLFSIMLIYIINSIIGSLGQDCDKDTDCKHGKCIKNKCDCDTGWSGDTCDKKIRP